MSGPEHRDEPLLPAKTQAELGDVCIVAASQFNLRRDIYEFIQFIAEKGLTRSTRGNNIPKAAALKLAKLLSWSAEAAVVERVGFGVWSEFVCDLSRHLGLVHFDTQGSYAGYSSQEPTFPNNAVKLQHVAWQNWLASAASAKEHALLDALIRTAPNEMLRSDHPAAKGRFDFAGSALGPLSRMELPKIRRTLYALLASLPPDRWYDVGDWVALVQQRYPTLILDPGTRAETWQSKDAQQQWQRQVKLIRKGAPLPEQPPRQFEDLYSNFREFSPGDSHWQRDKARQLTEATPDVFRRVEGRYLEWFLADIPSLCGHVELAWRADTDPHGQDVSPQLQRLRAFRPLPRLAEAWGRLPALDRLVVSVLPSFEVLVEAPSFPEATLFQLNPYCVPLAMEGPVYRLRLDQARVVAACAKQLQAPDVAGQLAALTQRPLPGNVADSLAVWCAHADKLVFFPGCALVELADDVRPAALAALGALTLDKSAGGFAVTRQPDAAFSVLDAAGLVPTAVRHGPDALAKCTGKLATSDAAPQATAAGASVRAPAQAAEAVDVELVDFIGIRSENQAFLKALVKVLISSAVHCQLAGNTVIVEAAALPKLRAATKALASQFKVTPSL